LSFFTLAGNFALAPPAVQRLFGPKKGALIFGVLFSAFGVASVGGNFLSAVRDYYESHIVIVSIGFPSSHSIFIF